MEWSLSFKDNFAIELAQLNHKKFKNQFSKARSRLVSSPNVVDGETIKKLKHFKSYWRYKIDKYRIIYEVNEKENNVKLLMLGQRAIVYKRIGYKKEGLSGKIIANDDKNGNGCSVLFGR